MSDELELDGYDHVIAVASGGTSTVFSAARITDRLPVAIKVFNRSAIRSYERRVSASQRLADVKSVPPILEHGELEDGRGVIVMPFAQGGSVADHLDRFGAAPTGDVKRNGTQIAHALEDAHAAGVIHRDIKPSNILFDRWGRALLADFGEASFAQLRLATATSTFTLLYSAPEVLEGAEHTWRSDIYSLALALLAFGHGTHPFIEREAGIAGLINQICNAGVSHSFGYRLPPDLRSVLQRATALDPSDRYETAAAFAEALDSVRRIRETTPRQRRGDRE